MALRRGGLSALAFLPLALGVRPESGSARASEGEVVYVGSTACDGDDGGCEDRPEAQRVVGALRVQGGGAISPLRGLAADVGSLPVWFAEDHGVQEGGCLFITRAAKDDILAVAYDADGKVAVPGTSSPSGGRNPVHASVVAAAGSRYLLVANYNGPDDTKHDQGASVASFRILEGCQLRLADVVAHHGSSSDPARQNSAHVHSVTAGPGGSAYACDLGTDEVIKYTVSPEDGKLHQVARFKATSGYGPRHSVVHPRLPLVYVVCEMAQVVLVLQPGVESGELSLIQELRLVQDGDDAKGSKAAEIVMQPDGSAIYVTNRGKLNTVTVFAVDGHGRLLQKQQLPTPAFPRGMALAQGGSVLLVAGQSKGEVASFSVNSDGTLEASGRLTGADGLPPNPGAFAVVRATVPMTMVA